MRIVEAWCVTSSVVSLQVGSINLFVLNDVIVEINLDLSGVC